MTSLWDWLEGLGTGISRSDTKTWRSPHWPPAFKGIVNCLEVAHQAFVWRIRGNPRLIKVSLPSICTTGVSSEYITILHCITHTIGSQGGTCIAQTSYYHKQRAACPPTINKIVSA